MELATSSLLNQGSATDHLARFLELSTTVEQLGMELNFLPRQSSSATKRLFSSASLERQLEILRDLESTRRVLLSIKAELQPTPRIPTTKERELKHLERFLLERNLRFGDPKFPDFLDNDDVIEIYDSRAIQIYRNFAYFRYCPYSLIELLLNDWNTLFVRPSWVIDELIKITPELFTHGAVTHAYELPEYLISARLQKETRGMLFKMKYASPLIDMESNQPAAFITTGQIRFAPDVVIGANVDFI